MARNPRKPKRRRNSYKARKGTLNKRVSGLGSEIGFRLGTFQRVMERNLREVGELGVNVSEEFNDKILKLYNNIKNDTPIDTGEARRGWRIKLETFGPNTIKWRIVNGVPYIVFLEFGHSKQRPRGMVRVNLDKFTRDLQRKIKRVIKFKAKKGGN